MTFLLQAFGPAAFLAALLGAMPPGRPALAALGLAALLLAAALALYFSGAWPFHVAGRESVPRAIMLISACFGVLLGGGVAALRSAGTGAGWTMAGLLALAALAILAAAFLF